VKIGISACLLGRKVRYDGTHKLDHYIKDILGLYAEWVEVCPETEIGLPVPREPIHLTGDTKYCRLTGVRSHTDLTGRMESYTAVRLESLKEEDLCGFIFKSRSPSCGISHVKIYPEGKDIASGIGSGMFAREFMNRFPIIPVEDEGRLKDCDIRENFIERIFAFSRWKEFIKKDSSNEELAGFNENHRLLLMSHSPHHVSSLDKIITGKDCLENKLIGYLNLFMEALTIRATVRKHTNVLLHIVGFLKNQLDISEQDELLEIIDCYKKELIPLIVPVTLLRHYIRKYDNLFLKSQYYLHPHPDELKLRNHA
jgi:uncharacterized protein YbbK (DUF523 family)/uncharacterized protein YbgA (DUF1722 family)